MSLAVAENKTKFRILSIDGGGIKGVFPASFLAELEKSIAAPIYQYFDLIAGTSTGGIIALCLGYGLTAAEVVDFYEKHGPRIFANPRGWLGKLFRPKYSAAQLKAALTGVFGTAILGDSRVRLLVPSLDATRGDIHIYKTRHHARFVTDHRVSMVDVALATTAAPTYFPAHNGAGGAIYIDGGMWANNPTANAVVEALSWLGIAKEEVDVLSIGCTQFAQSFAPEAGRAYWAKNAIEAALRGQSSGSLGIAYSLVGHPAVVRVNPEAPAQAFDLDKTAAIPELKSYGYSEARRRSSELIPRFFSTTAARFAPVPHF